MEEEILYNSWKERDILLEYNQVKLDDANIVNLLGLAVNNLTRDQSIVKTMRMIDNHSLSHIMLLNPYKMIRIRLNTDLRIIYNKASMYLASGAGIQWAAGMLGPGLKERIPVLSYIMDLIRIAEIKEYTIFIVGSKSEIVERAYSNIRRSFPKIRIVGRHGGFFNENRENAIIEAIQKSEPDIILVGRGFPKEEQWIYKLKSELKHGVLIGVGGSIDVISGLVKKAPPYYMTNGLEWFYRIITRPWRIGRLFLLFLFYLYFVIRRIFRRNRKKRK